MEYGVTGYNEEVTKGDLKEITTLIVGFKGVLDLVPSDQDNYNSLKELVQKYGGQALGQAKTEEGESLIYHAIDNYSFQGLGILLDYSDISLDVASEVDGIHAVDYLGMKAQSTENPVLRGTLTKIYHLLGDWGFIKDYANARRYERNMASKIDNE